MKKKLIITGCNGQLGRAINKELAPHGEYELVNTDVAELDITDIDKVMGLAREVKPYAILNCAAFTNVNGCETAGDIVWKINALGPRNLSIAATEVGAKMLHISTDYVFDGHGTGSAECLRCDQTGRGEIRTAVCKRVFHHPYGMALWRWK